MLIDLVCHDDDWRLAAVALDKPEPVVEAAILLQRLPGYIRCDALERTGAWRHDLLSPKSHIGTLSPMSRTHCEYLFLSFVLVQVKFAITIRRIEVFPTPLPS
jgi:hypothetical protein